MAKHGKKPSQDVLESGWKENANQSRSIITLAFSKFFKEIKILLVFSSDNCSNKLMMKDYILVLCL